MRTEHILTCQVGQHRFEAPFNVRENRLDASFYIQATGPVNITLKRKG